MAKRVKVKNINNKYKKNLDAIRNKAFTFIMPINVFFSASNEPTSKFYKERLDYKQVRKNSLLAKNFYDSGYIHITCPIPSGYSDLFVSINIGGEGLVYDNDNNPYEMISSRVIDMDNYSLEQGKTKIKVTDKIIKNNQIDFYIDCGFNGTFRCYKGDKPTLKYASLVKENKEISEFYYDFLSVVCLNLKLEDNSIETSLDKAYELFKSGDLLNAKNELIPYLNGKPLDFDIYGVGHSHLDLAWLWPIRETKRKAIRTLTAQINNINENDEYIYGVSQPWQLKQIKENEPELFTKIKDLVNKGKIELQGGMFVEADSNIPSGESLIRQIYYGKKFYKEEFNLDNRICWLPDVFGYNGNLPQILKKSGIDYFYTIKLSWNSVNRFPFRSFNWEGIDGSKVLVSMSSNETYNGDGSASDLIYTYENFPEKDIVNKQIYVYGVGDGGGGPSKSFIKLLERAKTLKGTPRFRFKKAIDYFDDLAKYKDKLPSYKGELYLEKHQGTYTSQSDNKKYNRELEFAICDIETLSSIAYLKGYNYDHDLINKWWEEILLYQFHDIIPGSSINRVYKESISRYKTIKKEIEAKRNELLSFLSGNSTDEIVYNPTSFNRVEYIDGKRCEIKPFSFAKLEKNNDKNNLEIKEKYMSNGLLTIRFNDSQEIVSVVNNFNDEFVKNSFNQLVLYKDKPMFFEAWDIDSNYLNTKPIILKSYKHEFKKEASQVIYKNYYKYKKNTYEVKTILKENCEYVLFEMLASSNISNMMLRANFEPTIQSDFVSCDIQYGLINRSTKDETSLDKAMFEICANKFVDVSDEYKGLSIISKSKYGYRVKNGLISLDLLRNPTFPDPTCDLGIKEFTYGFYPHKSSLSNSTIKNSYFINKPIIKFEGTSLVDSIISMSNEDIIVELIKKKENFNSLIIRMYEPLGKQVNVDVSLNFNYLALYETDLMENKIKKLNGINLSFEPFEIKTIEVEL